MNDKRGEIQMYDLNECMMIIGSDTYAGRIDVGSGISGDWPTNLLFF